MLTAENWHNSLRNSTRTPENNSLRADLPKRVTRNWRKWETDKTSAQARRRPERKWQQSRENYWRQSELAAEPDSDQIVRIRIKKMRKVWFLNWKGVFFVAVQTKCNSSSYQFRLKICLASCIHSLADARKKNVGRIASWKKRHLTAGKDPRIFNPLIQLLHH